MINNFTNYFLKGESKHMCSQEISRQCGEKRVEEVGHTEYGVLEKEDWVFLERPKDDYWGDQEDNIEEDVEDCGRNQADLEEELKDAMIEDETYTNDEMKREEQILFLETNSLEKKKIEYDISKEKKLINEGNKLIKKDKELKSQNINIVINETNSQPSLVKSFSNGNIQTMMETSLSDQHSDFECYRGPYLNLKKEEMNQEVLSNASSQPEILTSPSLEECWLITPAPCFAATEKGDCLKDSMEDLLIERPTMSVYCKFKKKLNKKTSGVKKAKPPQKARFTISSKHSNNEASSSFDSEVDDMGDKCGPLNGFKMQQGFETEEFLTHSFMPSQGQELFKSEMSLQIPLFESRFFPPGVPNGFKGRESSEDSQLLLQNKDFSEQNQSISPETKELIKKKEFMPIPKEVKVVPLKTLSQHLFGEIKVRHEKFVACKVIQKKKIHNFHPHKKVSFHPKF